MSKRLAELLAVYSTPGPWEILAKRTAAYLSAKAHADRLRPGTPEETRRLAEHGAERANEVMMMAVAEAEELRRLIAAEDAGLLAELPPLRVDDAYTPRERAEQVNRIAAELAKRGQKDGASNEETTFACSPVQQQVMNMLKGQAYTLDELAAELAVDRTNLHKRHLRELLAVGRIKNDRKKGGYFRPDAPPGYANQKPIRND